MCIAMSSTKNDLPQPGSPRIGHRPRAGTKPLMRSTAGKRQLDVAIADNLECLRRRPVILAGLIGKFVIRWLLPILPPLPPSPCFSPFSEAHPFSSQPNFRRRWSFRLAACRLHFESGQKAKAASAVDLGAA